MKRTSFGLFAALSRVAKPRACQGVWVLAPSLPHQDVPFLIPPLIPLPVLLPFLSVCLSFLTLCLCLSFTLSLSLNFFIYLSVYFYFYLCISLHTHPSIHPPPPHYISDFIFLSIPLYPVSDRRALAGGGAGAGQGRAKCPRTAPPPPVGRRRVAPTHAQIGITPQAHHLIPYYYHH